MTDTVAGKRVVLVVEDERPIAELVRLYLSRDGFGVQVEHDGTAGLAAARRLRPVACILDIALPGMDGTEICRRLREEGDWTPVVFLTARDDEIDRVLGLELGGDGYVTKPFSPRELVARIRAVLRRTAGPPQGGRVRTAGPVTLDPPPPSCPSSSRPWSPWRWPSAPPTIRPVRSWSRRPPSPSSCSPPNAPPSGNASSGSCAPTASPST